MLKTNVGRVHCILIVNILKKVLKSWVEGGGVGSDALLLSHEIPGFEFRLQHNTLHKQRP